MARGAAGVYRCKSPEAILEAAWWWWYEAPDVMWSPFLFDGGVECFLFFEFSPRKLMNVWGHDQIWRAYLFNSHVLSLPHFLKKSLHKILIRVIELQNGWECQGTISWISSKRAKTNCWRLEKIQEVKCSEQRLCFTSEKNRVKDKSKELINMENNPLSQRNDQDSSNKNETNILQKRVLLSAPMAIVRWRQRSIICSIRAQRAVLSVGWSVGDTVGDAAKWPFEACFKPNATIRYKKLKWNYKIEMVYQL